MSDNLTQKTIPLLGSRYKVERGEHKRKVGQVIDYYYELIAQPYWKQEIVLEPGIYKRFSGITIKTDNSDLIHIPEADLTTYDIESSDLQDNFTVDHLSSLLNLIPVTPITERYFNVGDLVRKNGEEAKFFIIDRINFDVLLFKGHYEPKTPAIVALELKVLKAYGFDSFEQFSMLKQGPLTEACRKEPEKVSEDDFVRRIACGMYPAIKKKNHQDIYYGLGEIKNVGVDDNEIVFPFNASSLRYVKMRVRDGIDPSLVKKYGKDHPVFS